MILLRTRRYGSDDWTLTTFDGTQEEFLAELLALAACENPNLHVQAAREGLPYSDLEEFDFDA